MGERVVCVWRTVGAGIASRLVDNGFSVSPSQNPSLLVTGVVKPETHGKLINRIIGVACGRKLMTASTNCSALSILIIYASYIL